MSKKKRQQQSELARNRQPGRSSSSTIQVAQEEIRFTAGPLPPAETLQQYESILPGSAERIVALAEGEATHRRALETKSIDAQILDRKSMRKERGWGQLGAFAISTLVIAVAAICALKGLQWGASILGGGGVGSIITAYMYGNRQQKESKAKDAPEEKS